MATVTVMPYVIESIFPSGEYCEHLSANKKSELTETVSYVFQDGRLLKTSILENVRSVDPEQLLTAFSIVFQDVTLFNNTVMENIHIGRNNATDEEVMEAARLANCDEFIEKAAR